MEGINLIHGDSLQALKGYADNHFDVAIVDPPYGIGESNKKQRTRKSTLIELCIKQRNGITKYQVLNTFLNYVE